MYTSSEIVERIESRAKALNIRKTEMLEACGCNRNTLTQLSDKKGLSSFSLARIADYLDCSVDYLLGRSDAPEKTAPGTPGADEVDSVIIEMFSRLSPEDKAIVLDLIERLLSGEKP